MSPAHPDLQGGFRREGEEGRTVSVFVDVGIPETSGRLLNSLGVSSLLPESLSCKLNLNKFAWPSGLFRHCSCPCLSPQHVGLFLPVSTC